MGNTISTTTTSTVVTSTTTTVTQPTSSNKFEYLHLVTPREAWNAVEGEGFVAGVKGVASAIGNLVLDLFKLLGNLVISIGNGFINVRDFCKEKFGKHPEEAVTIELEPSAPSLEQLEEAIEDLPEVITAAAQQVEGKASTNGARLAKVSVAAVVLFAALYFAGTKFFADSAQPQPQPNPAI